MIRLTYYDVENLDLKKGYELVSDKRKEKIDFYRFDKDKKLSCGAYLLLQKVLDEEGISKPEFKVGKYGKAYICNHEDIYFNISHSGKMVCCAISDREIGVDVEYNDPTIDLNIAKNYFYNSEYENIMKSDNPSKDSFEIIIDGDIKLKNDKNNVKFNLFDVDDYKLASAGHFNTKKLEKYDDLIK